jgi:hypothetical protein
LSIASQQEHYRICNIFGLTEALQWDGRCACIKRIQVV